MKKSKTIWIVILCIVLVGTAVTFYTQNRIARKESGDSLQSVEVLQLETESSAETSEWKKARNLNEESAFDTASNGDIAAPGSGPKVAETTAVADLEEEPRAETALEAVPMLSGSPQAVAETVAESLEDTVEVAEPETVPNTEAVPNEEIVTYSLEEDTSAQGVGVMISPLTGSVEAPVSSSGTVSYEEEKIRFSKRIADLEKQIAARWKNDTDETMLSKMTTAEYEYSIWENEMVQTMELLERVLNEQAYEQLTKDQMKWTKTREAEASSAAAKFQGSSRESLEYTKACSTQTKTRALQLANTYLEALQRQEE